MSERGSREIREEVTAMVQAEGHGGQAQMKTLEEGMWGKVRSHSLDLF